MASSAFTIDQKHYNVDELRTSSNSLAGHNSTSILTSKGSFPFDNIDLYSLRRCDSIMKKGTKTKLRRCVSLHDRQLSQLEAPSQSERCDSLIKKDTKMKRRSCVSLHGRPLQQRDPPSPSARSNSNIKNDAKYKRSCVSLHDRQVPQLQTPSPSARIDSTLKSDTKTKPRRCISLHDRPLSHLEAASQSERCDSILKRDSKTKRRSCVSLHDRPLLQLDSPSLSEGCDSILKNDAKTNRRSCVSMGDLPLSQLNPPSRSARRNSIIRNNTKARRRSYAHLHDLPLSQSDAPSLSEVFLQVRVTPPLAARKKTISSPSLSSTQPDNKANQMSSSCIEHVKRLPVLEVATYKRPLFAAVVQECPEILSSSVSTIQTETNNVGKYQKNSSSDEECKLSSLIEARKPQRSTPPKVETECSLASVSLSPEKLRLNDPAIVEMERSLASVSLSSAKLRLNDPPKLKRDSSLTSVSLSPEKLRLNDSESLLTTSSYRDSDETLPHSNTNNYQQHYFPPFPRTNEERKRHRENGRDQSDLHYHFTSGHEDISGSEDELQFCPLLQDIELYSDSQRFIEGQRSKSNFDRILHSPQFQRKPYGTNGPSPSNETNSFTLTKPSGPLRSQSLDPYLLCCRKPLVAPVNETLGAEALKPCPPLNSKASSPSRRCRQKNSPTFEAMESSSSLMSFVDENISASVSPATWLKDSIDDDITRSCFPTSFLQGKRIKEVKQEI